MHPCSILSLEDVEMLSITFTALRLFCGISFFCIQEFRAGAGGIGSLVSYDSLYQWRE